jgi:hypothetical protein
MVQDGWVLNMILTTEDFWCPRCGRLPQAACSMYVKPGHLGGWTTITCRRCGDTGGDICCRGETAACFVLSDGFCRFHANYIGANPHPRGKIASQARFDDWVWREMKA